ncbi:hypothetical protein MRX96_000969 [Rhipicephalus microplus]
MKQALQLLSQTYDRSTSNHALVTSIARREDFVDYVAVDRFLADSATIKVKGTDTRFEYRGLRTVPVRVYEYPADASDKVLSRALKVYGKVQNISNDTLTGLRITTGNRRARVELCSSVPNITDVDGHVVRCEYDGVVCLCRKCRLPGHERKMCTTPWCARCQQWGHSTCDAPCKRCGGDHPPHLCKQMLYSGAATRTSMLQVERPTASASGPNGHGWITSLEGWKDFLVSVIQREMKPSTTRIYRVGNVGGDFVGDSVEL